MRRALETLGGLYQLARLAAITGFRFDSPWWRWRLHTAFGKPPPTSRSALFVQGLEFARWMHRMRRHR